MTRDDDKAPSELMKLMDVNEIIYKENQRLREEVRKLKEEIAECKKKNGGHRDFK